MKTIKNLLMIACLASVHMSYTAQDSNNDYGIILTDKETQLIKTNRVLEKLSSILKSVEKAKDWSARNEATTPSKSQAIQIAAPLFVQALEEIIAQYATCYDATVTAAFGLSTMQEFHIVDNKASDIKIISNAQFMNLLEKAIKFFEKETVSAPFVEYSAKFLVEVSPSKKLTLHEVKDAIVRAIA
ncbi:hypothetical protein [Candidatus Chromulinivorax destructor]|uniref:Uncharacterized protein n=1 Tax=Candidatus Chromulinivorax destructor TaxID=2066483 RepID=A0A345ZBD9_9BACT|nr:hypothetical protein [Candidatus Chromulinivorax destructor]AXK60606.1 hypothetical protein C0J27_02505 [Candidatus Chromulinivorax destructor]